VNGTWESGTPSVLTLPLGRLVRGRALRDPRPEGPDPEFALYLTGSEVRGATWEVRWVPWPDFGLPADPQAARAALVEALERAATERVEVGCVGGRGRTGTALACLAVLDGIPADEAVAYVRRHYFPDAVETDEQQDFVARFS
jgi:protein-tyrosine phosphatase